jgi:Ca-activated chloride channel homolog
VRGALKLLAVVAIGGIGVRAQDRPRFQSSVEVVTVTATVVGRNGRLVSGLSKDDFTVFEDGQRREVVHFEDEASPVSLAILLDASGSMAGKLRLARDVISRLVTHDLAPSTEWLFAHFGFSLVTTQEWTSDREAITQPLRQVRATGDTALYDAIALTIPLAESGHFQKKAVLLVSDGGESKSLLSLEDVQKAIGENDVRIYGTESMRRTPAEQSDCR